MSSYRRAVSAWSAFPREGGLIDWSGYTVLPGLIDMHAHVADGFADTNDPTDPLKHTAAETAFKDAQTAGVMLEAGFTTIRDVGVYRGLSDVALRNAIESGEVEGPRMVVAGAYITVPGGGGAVTGSSPEVIIPADFRLREVRDANEARDRARYLLQHGADFIKLVATGAVLAIGSEPGQLELSEAEMKALPWSRPETSGSTGISTMATGSTIRVRRTVGPRNTRARTGKPRNGSGRDFARRSRRG